MPREKTVYHECIERRFFGALASVSVSVKPCRELTFYMDNFSSSVELSGALKNILYCPWCGADLRKEAGDEDDS